MQQGCKRTKHAVSLLNMALYKKSRLGERGNVMNVLKETPTCQLVEELKSREAVKTIIIELCEDFTVSMNSSAVVLIVAD